MYQIRIVVRMKRLGSGRFVDRIFEGISEVYNFRGKKDTARQHLIDAGVAPLSGRAELGIQTLREVFGFVGLFFKRVGLSQE